MMKKFYYSIISVMLLSLVCANAETMDKQVREFKNSPVILGYYSQWAVYSPNIHVQDVPSHLMTHLVYQSANLTEEGVIEPGDSFADIEHLYPSADREEDFLGSFSQLLSVKQRNKQLKTIISIGGWGRSEHFSTLTTTDEGRQKIAQNAINYMKKYQFDGIEIDWQFPIYRSRSSGVVTRRDSDPNHLGLLMQELNKQCREQNLDCWLQVVLAPYSFDDAWKAKLLSKNVDIVVIDVTRLPGDNGEFAEPQSPIYTNSGRRSIDSVVTTMVDYGVEKEKIALSIASFAVGWEGVKNTNNGLGQRPEKLSWGSWDSKFSGATGVYNQKNLQYFLSLKEYKHFWDDTGKTSFLFNPDKYGGHFITYENTRAISEKVAYAKRNQLSGIAIRQLHNGDSTLLTVFKEYHFFKSLFYNVRAFWQDNRNALIVLIQMLTVIFIGLVSFIFLNSKRNRQIYQERQTFNKIQYLLHGLEQPLLNMVSVSEKVQERGLLSNNGTSSLVKLSSSILQPISNILVESTLKSAVDRQIKEAFSFQPMLLNICTLFSLSHKRKINEEVSLDIQLFTNPTELHQLLFNLFDFVDQHIVDKNIEFSFTGTKELNYLELNLSYIAQDSEVLGLNHYRLNSLYQQAQSLGFTLNVDNQLTSNSLLVPLEFVTWKSSKYFGLSFDITQRNESLISESLDVVSEDIQQQLAYQEPIKQVNSPVDEQSNLFIGITSFNMSSSPSKDIYKGLEQASQYFIDLLDQDAKITINHHEQLVAKLGEQSLCSRHEILVNANDIDIEIVTKEKLSEQDQQLIQVLVYQTLMVQKSIQALLKEPTILSELHQLTSSKDKIKYLKAESGYTGIYVQGRKEPKYISMRLRTVRLYFDEDALLQIHRSYLVNPKKVEAIKRVSKLKFELVIGKEVLPVSRTYIPTLQQNFPHWFE